MRGLRTQFSVHLPGLLIAMGIVFGVCRPVPGQCEITKLLPSGVTGGDSYGSSVAIDGDMIVVGALFDDDNGLNSGAAYMFRWNGSAWVEQIKLFASDGAAGDRFGSSVAISGDVAIVGARRDDDNGSDSGSAYVFSWNGSRWVQQAKLLASDGAADDTFGAPVAIDSDVAIVGAWQDDHNGPDSGSAYVFERPPGGWVDMTETGKLTASDITTNEKFGIGVAIDGDVAVIGALKDENAGAAYVFQRPPGGWVDMTETAKLLPSDIAVGDDFGFAVAIDGDLVLIGARSDDDNGLNSGSAYVFHKLPGGWVDMTETAKLLPSDGGTGDRFGFSVSIDGNVAVFGAYFDSHNGITSGSAYVFEKPPRGWVDMTETAKLTASDAGSNHQFGFSVAIDGDVAVIGANQDDANGSSSGSAYVFAGLAGIDCNSNGQPDACDILDGTSKDSNGNGVPDECEPIPGDLDGDGSVGVKDLLILLGNWGLCRDCNNCPADLNGDCNVGVVDLLILLGNWG